MNRKRNQRGFTLIEMLLVMVIISIVIFASIGYMQQRAQQVRIDRTASQLQQILNAGLAFYVANGRWPANINELRTGGFYLPPPGVVFGNPWGRVYSIAQGPSPTPPPPGYGTGMSMFYAWTVVPGTAAGAQANVTANAIAGNLPLGFASSSAGVPNSSPPTYNSPCAANADCTVAASVNVPGQNINMARSVNFAGLYRNGACVPVPQCPVDVNGNAMQPQIMVVPVSVSGFKDYDPATKAVYPISSFTAYAKGPTNLTAGSPPACTGSTEAPPCNANIQGNPATAYWRACLQVVTEQGNVQPATTANTRQWGGNVTLMAVTRCAVTQEPAGSNFTIFSN